MIDDELDERYRPDPADILFEEELRELRAEGSTRKPPKPTGNVCRKCVPVFERIPKPSGRIELVFRHSIDCPDKPLGRIRAGDYDSGGRRTAPWDRGER